MKAAAVFVLAVLVSTVCRGQSALFFFSQLGEYVGAGEVELMTDADGQFASYQNANSGIEVSFFGDPPFCWWLLTAEAGDGTEVSVGLYENAATNHLAEPGQPVFDFSGCGRGGSSTNSWFEVFDIHYDVEGNLTRVAMDFSQPSDGPEVFGSLRFNSTIPVTLMVFSDGFESANQDAWSSPPFALDVR